MTVAEAMAGRQSLLPWIAPFSMPLEPAQEAVFDTIAGAHGTALTRLLLERHADAVESHGDGLLAFLAERNERPASLRTIWDISFGRAQSALTTAQLSAQDAAAGLGLRLAEVGEPGRWVARCNPMPVLIGGHLIMGVVGINAAIDVGGAGSLLLERQDKAPTLLRRDRSGEWHAGPEVQRLRRVGDPHEGMLLLPRQALPDDERTRAALAQCQAVAAVDDEMHAVFSDGFNLLQDVLPDYARWVTRTVHGIVVCAIEAPFHLISGSWEDVPGFIHISSPHVAVDIAEILVHEASHQYFYLLQRVGPVDDGSDHTLYWSPPIRRNRPLSRVFMAFHALVNVLKLYEAIERLGGAEARYAAANAPALRRDIAVLRKPLHGNPALTPFGRSLYEPLGDFCDELRV